MRLKQYLTEVSGKRAMGRVLHGMERRIDYAISRKGGWASMPQMITLLKGQLPHGFASDLRYRLFKLRDAGHIEQIYNREGEPFYGWKGTKKPEWAVDASYFES